MADKSNITPYIPKLNLFLDVNMTHLEELIHLLGKEIGLRDKRQIKGLKLLLCNMYLRGRRQVLVSRRKQSLGSKRYNPLGIGYSPIRNSLDKLENAGYIIQIIGDYDIKTSTTMEPTNKLIQWFEDAGWSDEGIDKRVGTYVTLRKNEKETNKTIFIEYEDTTYSIWLSKELKKYNQLLSETTITILNEDGEEVDLLRKTTIQRKFIKHNFIEGIENTEFIFGGRMPGPWANFSSEARKGIKINGEPTVELDRKASHLNAMYQVITGKPYPYDDPYTITIDGTKVPRHIAKNFCSFMQGSSSKLGTAKRVANHYRREAKEVNNPKQKDIDKYEEYVQFKKKVKPTVIVEAILKRHPKVGKSYMKGKAYGDFIGCWESDIVFEVVMELTKRGIPCLTVYDSFIVPLQYIKLVDSIKDSTPYIDRRGITKVLPK